MNDFPHAFPFDPRYGYDQVRLLAVAGPAEPEDFAEFWRATFRQTVATPLRLTRRGVAPLSPGNDLFEVEFDGIEGGRVGAWVMVPRGKFARGVVVGHGYGGRERPDDRVPGPAAVAIFPCARGFHRSKAAGIPGNAAEHVVHGLSTRETYIHRMCVADLWSAASALLQMYPHVADCLDYQGGSFGGGTGAMAVAWDHRIRRAFLDVPSFGNHPLRVTLPCVGSGEAVRLLYQQRPEIMAVLKYFDAATAARHIRIPTLAACALFDPAVPPPGQFAVYNALAGEKTLFVRPAAHFDYPEGASVDAAVFARMAEFFQAL